MKDPNSKRRINIGIGNSAGKPLVVPEFIYRLAGWMIARARKRAANEEEARQTFSP